METLKPSAQKDKLFNRYFLSIVVMALFFDTCTRFFMGTFSLYIDSLGESATIAGLMMTIFTITAAVFRTIGGRFSDAYGRRLTVLIGVTGYAVASILLSITTNISILFVIRLFQGLFFAVGGAGFSVAVSDVIPESRLTEGLGYYGLSATMANAVGPMVGLFIMGVYGFNSVVYLAVALCVISWFITFFICNYEKDPKYQKPMSTPAPSEQLIPDNSKISGFIGRVIEKKALPAGITIFFFVMATGSTMGFIALYTDRLGFGSAGLFFVFQSIAAFVTRIAIGKIADRRGPLYNLIPGLLLSILGYSLLVFAGYSGVPFLLYLSGLLCGFGSGLTFPTLTALAIRFAPVQRRGAAMGTYYTLLEISLALGGVLWGALIDHVGFDIVFFGSAFSCAVSLVFAGFFFNNKRLSRSSPG